MGNKYKPLYSLSKDFEDVELKVTAKRIGGNYIFDLPTMWIIDEERKLITICGLNPPKGENIIKKVDKRR